MKQAFEGTLGTVLGIKPQSTGNLAYGSAEIARFAWDRLKNESESYWLVDMNQDRLFLDGPSFLTDKPITKKYGRVGNGVLMRVIHRANEGGYGCYAVIHFCGNSPVKVDLRDRVTCERLAQNNDCGCYLDQYRYRDPESHWSRRLNKWFLADMILLWRDGSFTSLRESGLVQMDGGSTV